MTKPTSPLASAGLPSLDRRSLVRGLGAAAFAGVPAGAGAALISDPVFQALIVLDRLKIRAEEADAVHSVAEEAFFSIRNIVTIDSKEMRTHEQIDAHFRPVFGPEDEEKFNRFVERLRPRHLSPAEQAERDRVRKAAHGELTRHEAEIAEFEQRTGYREIEARHELADSAVWDAEYDVMKAVPSTTAGAVALLRFTATLMEPSFQDDEGKHCVMVIRNAADFFERSATA